MSTFLSINLFWLRMQQIPYRQKTPIFQSKQPVNRKHRESFNRQFTTVLNIIICFSVRFWDNSLLVLKMTFQVFLFRKQKRYKGFQWQEDINVVVTGALLCTKPCLSFLKFWCLAKIFGKTFILSLKSILFRKELWEKPFISRTKQFKRNLRHAFADERQLKIKMPK